MNTNFGFEYIFNLGNLRVKFIQIIQTKLSRFIIYKVI